MSNIYVTEPPTSGKVVLATTAGEIDVELWSKQAPKACRNFIQLCIEGAYDNTVFHRVVPGWIVQGGDLTGTGEGGESIYGTAFADEFHSRLRFTRRGLLGMASTGPNGNGSQFFITLAPTPELQKKHTIFGTVVGDSLFNALKLAEGDIDKATERPVYPKSILHARILDNPFPDIVPRETKGQAAGVSAQEVSEKRKGPKTVKNRKLLSFGDDGDDDCEVALPRGGPAMKSSHDLLRSDPTLSNKSAVQRIAEPKVPLASPNLAKGLLEPKVQEELATRLVPPMPHHKELSKDLGDHVVKEVCDSAVPEATQSALSEMLARYKTPHANKDLKRPKNNAREDELLARLGNFQTKIRKTKLQPSSHASLDAQPTERDLCQIHRQPSCGSCRQDSSTSDPVIQVCASEASSSDDWLAHSLKFKNSKVRASATEYVPKFDDYVTIDPRKEASNLHSHT
ncbi:Peptidyl-prolyl isomerase cwc27 [Coemansia sp. BCRC 34301]|nr:Peptidyl-prolyl isomerase cwc27 [Coemansia sp. BCRC 34301]